MIDVVLEAAAADALITVEAQSDLRRLEQQIRWAHAKSAALADARSQATSSLLLLRNGRRTRAVVAEHAATLRAAYSAPGADAHAALTSVQPWPGPAILWADMAYGRARVRSAPPRGIPVGR